MQLELYDGLGKENISKRDKNQTGRGVFLNEVVRQYTGVGLNGLVHVLNWTIVWCGGNEESMPAGIERNAR